jgi:VanZ family protein
MTAFYGMLIEILQVSLPVNRSFEFYDWVANVCGALFFAAVALWFSDKFLNKD